MAGPQGRSNRRKGPTCDLDPGFPPHPPAPAFSLIVVDECHHTHKDTVYNVILSQYLEHKLQSPRRLPQVLGLTASPGTGGNSKLEGAISHILQVRWALGPSCPSLVRVSCQGLLTPRPPYPYCAWN